MPSLNFLRNFKMDEKIIKFIKKMHLLSLAVTSENEPYAASCFYAFDENNSSFIVAGSDYTTHVRAALGGVVSGTVALDTKVIGRIEGLQFKGEFMRASELEEKIYFKRFPYALPMKPQIFSVKLSWIKFTSNTLGFGKKIIWNRV